MTGPSRVSYTSRVSTPLEPLPHNAYADFAPNAPGGATAMTVVDPDDPPWGVGAAAFTWLSSMALMMIFPLLGVVVYAVVSMAGGADPAALGEALKGDPNITLASIYSMFPAHLATLAVVWAVVTNYGKRPFRQTVGWGWSERFGFWSSVGLAVLLLAFGVTLLYFLGRDVKTPFEEMLESSAQARFATALLATATAPLVEELVYRGVLYPAVRRAVGVFWAVTIVSSLFTVIHLAQYYNNPAVVAAVGSLAVALTYVRARTGRVLPCVVIHLVFNGLQCVGLVLDYFKLMPDEGEAKPGFVTLAANLIAHFTPGL